MNDNIIVPDIIWYETQRTSADMPVRCPYASAHRCPRYYQSLSLLGEAGSTAISASDDRKLLRKWKKSDLWPLTQEQAAAVLIVDGSPRTFSNLCPEIAYDRFGYFAHYLHRYSDELDRDVAHQCLAGASVPGDWRWSWSTVLPLHYSQCPLFSPLREARGRISANDQSRSTDVLGLKIGACGISFDVRAAWRRFRAWLLSKP